ncbi:tRNA (N(6)-L-threonylcarbamoyladenosine(37)-C(2))-methylthiotransferase MtaB [Treponema vincentii]|uniref:tRNA (N(6)-L-threonylcarbamoyladenosine(37)-C(2))- methylthiotransferase MtaB n=1 Tax=Treponema vincentii TaxID=69710 RepID=UPI0020A3A12D|nr:tRNA (N(6)-L-threonylcarbamoyladenosine(37)-C(2))-methylthiotransferase MtaB [Treponema vincentii]UTC59716.1 tRNA (N(6)-L-threonylcarbamoyladenosine(37)-C(2))-methylthiotransferase MtaB [Treponema vincentii]
MNTQLCAIRIETLGCRLNQAEAESFAALCIDAGFSIYTGHTDYAGFSPVNITETPIRLYAAVPPEQTALCFVNTCTVTGKAEQKARRLIRLLIKEHPYAVILVTGCYAQLEAAEIEALHPHVLAFPGQQKDLLTAIPAYFAELVRGSAYFDTAFFLSALRTYLSGLTGRIPQDKPRHHKPVGDQSGHGIQRKPLFALSSPHFLFHSRALLKIQDGCNDACAYCRIRLARGKSVSLPAAEVLERLRCIEETGVPEVTLTGVNLSQYRSEAGDFAGILKLILENSTIRVRISSLYPDRIDEALVPLLAHPRICPHFHLSVQSGSDAVLKTMHRGYKNTTVYHAVSELRRVKGDPFIGADIITGFPGETEADFEETYRMCRELNFAGIHAFPFSARPGTEAWKMQPKVPERIAGQRVKKLNELAETQAAAYLHGWDGKFVYGVTEAPRNGRITVITENYLSLPLIKESLSSGVVLLGGEYVRVQVQEEGAVLTDIISRPHR